jgi:glycosyltransferase involved in cell wall biosynthesis
MTNWPDVTVVICTYDRPEEIRTTISSLIANIKYPPEHLYWHIADDGTPSEPNDPYPYQYTLSLIKYLGDRGQSGRIRFTRTDRKGWGANVNAAIKDVRSDYIYFTEDDYVLLKPLDLRPYVAIMEMSDLIGMIRFGIAGHSLTAALREFNIMSKMPEYQENGGGRGSSGLGTVQMWLLDRFLSSGPYSEYLYSNRPHLVHKRFYDVYGLYPEGILLGDTELAYNAQIKRGSSTPEIACPANWCGWNYDHIGHSRQGTKEDTYAAD